ncbi:procollagen-lysine,2-oxoglutarate 5-dioxygenase 1 [Folsomia candida]|uniref:procollagen-lysine,2-oxoglutarate 5-dioxygenase 1 n=1 Tax=Folsomia candida TaxID=158441 RepID=UPI000B907C95|nr:procollagen-lysine,2-oxoglutarate 5-dioxygenase 1 [Folsomia candida]
MFQLKNGFIAFLVVILPLLALKTTADANDSPEDIDKNHFHVLTVATKWTESLVRYLRSAKVNGLTVEILGLGDQWEGGEVRVGPGGGQKVNLVKTALEKMKDLPDFDKKVVMFTDSYDILLLGNTAQIFKQFKMSNSKVLFGAESFCWPDEKLSNDYPEVLRGKRYLNSGGYIGYASTLYELLRSKEIANADDDQLFFTKLFLDEELRSKHKIKLDSKSSIFQNLNGATGELEMRFVEGSPVLFNTQYNTYPLVLHGNGPTKTVLNSYGNYLPTNWNEESGCASCWDEMTTLADIKEDDLKPVLIGVFIERPTPFLEEFLHKITLLDYPKKKVHFFLHNNVEYHSKLVNEFIANYTKTYASFKKIIPEDKTKEWHARNLAVEEAVKKDCGYFLSVDGEAHLDNPFTLKLLIEQNRGVVAPMLVRPYKAWSNFWGALTSEGFYARSNDYMDIVKGDRRGLWNVPFLSGAYLVNGSILNDPKLRPNYINNLLDADMAFCLNNRNNDVFMYVSNRVDWGHLVNSDNFETTHLYNELYQIFDNRWDWELRYLHPNWSKALDPNRTVEAMMKDPETMPCPDVFWFPIVTPRYCVELIGEMENFGQWSDGSNYDTRLDGGYENVPTVDIHTNQVGMEAQWLEFLRLYVEPLQSKVFTGYHHYPPYASMNFIVRYKPDEQRELKPHHDTSTYTINIALNTPHVDYEGGGCRFTRYNCSVVDTKLGHVLMHPGKLTHQHEGLRILKGTRYIMISFVDP